MTSQFRNVSRPQFASTDLGDCDIHVWKARLDLSRDALGRLERSLSPDERQRFGRLRAEPDRRQGAASRGLLRYILSGYAGRPAEELVFTYGLAGKPELSEAADGGTLRFNTAHSGDLLLVALGRAPSLGIDVERIRPIVRRERVARRAFSAAERRQIEALPHDLRDEAFITCWTRKEACVKALGEGVWSAFGRFEVSVEASQPATVKSVAGEAATGADWSLYHLEPAPGFVGAVAVQGTGWRLWTGTLQPVEASP
jgi:4'-phosphopantetheinyl transferase